MRLEAEGSDGKQFKKHLVQYFWEDVENRMRLMKVDDRNIQAETSRELLSMFYGLVFAYDEGLKNGDDVLAAAVWRNLFHASKAQATTQDLAVMVEYIRKEVQASDNSFQPLRFSSTRGHWWGAPTPPYNGGRRTPSVSCRFGSTLPHLC